MFFACFITYQCHQDRHEQRVSEYIKQRSVAPETEYTILDAGELAEFAGFTAEEVEGLCKEYDMDYEECKRWYDGYRQYGLEIYNPESVVQSMVRREYDNYWGKTSSYKVISDRIRSNYAGIKDSVIKMIAGESVDVNVTRYLNTMDSFENRNDEFTYLIHVGYLAYDKKEKTCRIPDNEIRQEWQNAIETEAGYEETNRIIEPQRSFFQKP